MSRQRGGARCAVEWSMCHRALPRHCFGAGRSGTLPAEGGGDWSTCLLGLGRFGVGYVIAQTFDNLTTTKADDQQGAAGG